MGDGVGVTAQQLADRKHIPLEIAENFLEEFVTRGMFTKETRYTPTDLGRFAAITGEIPGFTEGESHG
jgi:hypothetical protein